MVKLEIAEEVSGCEDTAIVRGKRTKRPRPSCSASTSGGGEYSASSGISTTTEEDEDMANCLILLAHGGSTLPYTVEENTPTAAGKLGVFVYECKTCYRTFPSFQALGGHRASHKRPKSAGESDREKSPAADRERDEEKFVNLKAIPPPLPPHTPSPFKAKIHECSICGSEFASGQALGGHMRRHRPPPSTGSKIDPFPGDKKARSLLELDLNLPAPPEEETTPVNFPPFARRVWLSPRRRWWVVTTRCGGVGEEVGLTFDQCE